MRARNSISLWIAILGDGGAGKAVRTRSPGSLRHTNVCWIFQDEGGSHAMLWIVVVLVVLGLLLVAFRSPTDAPDET